jgi:hypothetical protein
LAQTRHSYYSEIRIPKKSGGVRKIHAVKGDLKNIQDKILVLLQSVYNGDVAPDCVCGFVPGRSIVTNAEKHTNKKFVINLDIKDFFSSITLEKINRFLSHKPFSLHRNGYINVIITALSTKDNVLPQGAPTSPILSNIVLKNLDYALVMIAKKYKLRYSRYADDLTFSGNGEIDYNSFVNTINQKLIKHGFTLNKNKSRIQYYWQRQLVTGLVVNEKVNVKAEFLSVTRSMLYNWENYGFEKASKKFNEQRRPGDGVFFINVLRGRIDFIGSVLNKKKLYSDPIYTELNLSYWTLLNCLDYSFITDQKIREKLFDRNFEGEKIAIDKSFYETQEYRFVSYCFKVYTQIELLYKYYFYLKFDKDFKRIGLFMFKNNKNIKKQFKKMILDFENEEDHLLKAMDRISNIKNLRMITTFNIEALFIDTVFYKKKRSLHRFFHFVREIRNYHAHAGDFIVKQTFDEVKADIGEIIKKRELGEILIDSRPFKGLSDPEQRKINHYQFYLWYESCPFNDVRDILNEISYEVKILEKAKKMPLIIKGDSQS